MEEKQLLFKYRCQFTMMNKNSESIANSQKSWRLFKCLNESKVFVIFWTQQVSKRKNKSGLQMAFASFPYSAIRTLFPPRCSVSTTPVTRDWCWQCYEKLVGESGNSAGGTTDRRMAAIMLTGVGLLQMKRTIVWTHFLQIMLTLMWIPLLQMKITL